MSTDAYPLSWPAGWPRTAPEAVVDGQGRFQRPNREKGYGSTSWTFAAARDALYDELERISPGASVISSNFAVSRGVPVEGKRRPVDEGVAIYFNRAGRPYAMACDWFSRAEENMRSLALSIEAMRQLERHGGGVMVERAYEGFTALPAPARPWEILEITPDATVDQIRSAWRSRIKAAQTNPGSVRFDQAEINVARDTMLKAHGA